MKLIPPKNLVSVTLVFLDDPGINDRLTQLVQKFERYGHLVLILTVERTSQQHFCFTRPRTLRESGHGPCITRELFTINNYNRSLFMVVKQVRFVFCERPTDNDPRQTRLRENGTSKLQEEQ